MARKLGIALTLLLGGVAGVSASGCAAQQREVLIIESKGCGYVDKLTYCCVYDMKDAQVGTCVVKKHLTADR